MTKQFIAPKQNKMDVNNRAWFAFLTRGIEETSGRVAESLDPDTATVADVVNALKAAGLMKSG